MPNSPKEGTVWTVPVGKHNTAMGKLFNNLGDQGASIITQLDEDDRFNKATADFMRRRGIEPSIDQRIAHAYMGKNYWGPEDWVATHGGIYTKKQLRELAHFPWNEEVLMSTCPLCGKTVRDCHFAHVGLETIQGQPLSIVKFKEFYPETGQPKFYAYANAWYNDNDFAKVTTLSPRWYLTHIEIVPKSENKTTQDQQAMLPAEYELPLAIEETVKSFHCVRKTGSYPNPKRYARCRDISSDGFRVRVGRFGSGGFRVDPCSDALCYGNLGAGASRKYLIQTSNT
ncbi:TPA: hypothetical protein DIC39_00150 [Patescibacteria group bacterium]|nr:hypothetical protein [Patescibacteria group bacterium]